MNTFSPPIEISRIQLFNDHAVHVIREDLLPGGTKQRAIIPFLEDLIRKDHHQFVYASPFCGFAQIALAFAGGHLNKQVTLFCETVKGDAGKPDYFHEFSLFAQSLGAHLVACDDLADAEQKAQIYARQNQAFLLPLGFNHEIFLAHYSEALSAQFKVLKQKLDFSPKVLWLPIGSGTLARLFRKVLPTDIILKCVDVRVLPSSDQRIAQIKNLSNVEFYRSDLSFHEESEILPPLPSNKYYDAKIWSFITRLAEHNDIWWNVAR